MPRTILVVDDEMMNREILINILSGEYNVLTAESGAEALAIMRQKHSFISAVLLDLKMPQIDGFDVLQIIRDDSRFRAIPVIVVTALTDLEAEERAVSLGAYGFVTKPYKSVLIKHHLKNAISFREAAAFQNKIRRDDLTNILNLKGFTEQAEAMLSSHPDGYYLLSCFDIDNFKIINDQYGTEKGDLVLRHIAKTLNNCVASLDGICCRIGADHFAALYPVEHLGTQAVQKSYFEALRPECISRTVSMRIGRYLVEDNSVSVSTMCDRAVLAKDSIRGRFDIREAVYDDTMHERLLREQQIVGDMVEALAKRQFEVWFQPQYNHTTGALVGAEALVRWRHPERGLIAPSDFIPIFERNGFIYSLDKYVWEQVCASLSVWTDDGKNPLPVSVNISRQDFANDDLVDVLVDLTQKYHIPISMLRLEITETAFAEASAPVAATVRRLIEKGFTVEIDDFGSGYSSLNTLKDIPAQVIKLDMKFLESGSGTERGGNIIESVVRMAKWLGMSVIAEGVETQEQADYLRSIGCVYVQGYLYARPMPVKDYEKNCLGSDKEERLLVLETVENLDNNSFWNPESMDTLIFNSYVGGACIYEYHNGSIELIRATQKYAQIIGGESMSVEDVLKLSLMEFLDEESRERIICDIEMSVVTKSEVTGEYLLLDLPGRPHETFLRSAMRVIASTGNRYLIYCINENITAERLAEREAEAFAVQLRGMMDDMPGGFVRMSIAQDNTIKPVYVNEGFVTLMRMSRSETMKFMSKDPFTGVHPDDIDALKVTVAKALAHEETYSARYRFLRGSEYIWLAVFGRLTKDAAGNSFLNIYFSDATKQVKQEELQKALLDNLPGGAGIYELKNGQMSMNYQNDSYYELIGLKDATFPDPTPMSAVHPEDIQVIMGELAGAIEQKRDISCNIRLRHLTTGYFPVHLAGRIVYKGEGNFLIYATFTPIYFGDDSFRQTLPLLLSAIMESTTDLAFIKDCNNFQYLICSRTFADYAGQANERDIIGKTDYDLFDKELADLFRQSDEALLASGEPLFDTVEAFLSADGSLHYSETSKFILRDGSGKVIGIYGTVHDITKFANKQIEATDVQGNTVKEE